MHWTKQVIALKANQRTLQVFDLMQRVKVQSTTMSEDVLFWKWFSPNSLGLVTETAVFHWDVYGSGQTQPIKIFERNNNLSVGFCCCVGWRRLTLR